MFARKFVILNLIVHVLTVISYVDVAHALRCNREPEGTGARRSPSTGNFRLRFSDDSNLYKPGRPYTVFLERSSNAVRGRDRPQPKFTAFVVAVETKNSLPGKYAEEFSPDKHGTFRIEAGNILGKLMCGNVVTHTSETAKSEIYVNWTAPAPGSGCVTFRATIIEHRDVWYMDDGPLTKEICEDEQVQDDIISNVLEECCACSEAKYELTFEGLWSRNTHPKDFPQNVYTTKFGDIIGATHTVGNGFWANGVFASEGLKEVAEMGITRTIESELKNKSDNIRTIIKARGLSYPNITGKTFAVFRVDREHHLVSFVSMISPSPDWFVGISSFELCLRDCTWLESKVIDLYPWDAGTDKGTTYDSPDQPSKPQEYIRHITSESPNNPESPFYSPNGSKMKPLARLTLLRQRLYEKNCTADQSENEENSQNDPDCEGKVYYSDWSKCVPDCKTRENMTGKRIKTLQYEKQFKYCFTRSQEERQIKDDCDIPWCSNQNQDRNNEINQTPESTDPATTNEPEQNEDSQNNDGCMINGKPIMDRYMAVDRTKNPCIGTCGRGKRKDTHEPYAIYKECKPFTEEVDCDTNIPCINKAFCANPPDKDNCERDENKRNLIFYNATNCVCSVFTTNCTKQESTNIFESIEECKDACPEDLTNGDCNGFYDQRQKQNQNKPRNNWNRFKQY
ncbi:spondin-1-like isoform X2 [Contarinia nasturtii]|uniref:spondin-1-like isoform X2 n=1 Tax=Contarinia nasturtii TaxID=265458 RepID=UPI0012D3EE08|nr:spondin-1-like isoform X2 [Contarinia nasturtii]